jgi:hypothetical protein
VLTNVEEFLKSGRPGGTTLEAVETEPPKLAKGETVIDAIERLRRRGRELQADLHRIRSAPYPSAHAKRKMREQVEVWAQRGAANVAGLVEHGDGKIEFQREMLRVQMHNIPKAPAAIGYAEAIDAVAVIAWLAPDLLIRRLDAEIDSEADDKSSLSHEDRQRRESEVLLDILANDRDESFFVWQAQSQNLPVEHRSDCSPLAILQCRLVTAPPRAVPASTWQHSYELVQAGR